MGGILIQESLIEQGRHTGLHIQDATCMSAFLIFQYLSLQIQNNEIHVHVSGHENTCTWKLQFAEEDPMLWVESYEFSNTMHWCERLINSIIHAPGVYSPIVR